MKPAGGSKHEIVQDGASTDCRCARAAPRATHHTCVMAGRSRVRGVVLLTCQAGTLDGRPSFFAGGIREPSSMPACATRFCSSAQARLVGLVAVSLNPHQRGCPECHLLLCSVAAAHGEGGTCCVKLASHIRGPIHNTHMQHLCLCSSKSTRL